MKRIFALSLLLAVMAQPSPAARAQSAGPVYIIQSGDNCTQIAWRFGVSLEALITANNLTADCWIQPGGRLTIPMEGITGVLGSHIVALGETLPVLAMRLGLPVETLIRLNRIVQPDRVFAGEDLTIVESEDATPAVPRWETGQAVSLAPGRPLLVLAAEAGRSPWELAVANGLSSQADQIAGQTVFIPGGDIPLRAWQSPLQEIRLRSEPLVQGETADVMLSAAASIVEGSLAEWPLRFFAQDAGFVALQGMPAQTAPGTYPLWVKATGSDGRTTEFRQDVLLVRGSYATELTDLQVPAELLDPASMTEETARVKEFVGVWSADKLWMGAFTPPSVLGIASWFGNSRSYNGGTYTAVHGGVDYYGAEGTPILAPANGKVVFTGPMTICGNSTILFHGWNVYSRVCHQSKMEVQVGDAVQQGQEIGQVGKTGRATGPHLHWEMWVGGVQVNPLEWIETAFP